MRTQDIHFCGEIIYIYNINTFVLKKSILSRAMALGKHGIHINIFISAQI